MAVGFTALACLGGIVFGVVQSHLLVWQVIAFTPMSVAIHFMGEAYGFRGAIVPVILMLVGVFMGMGIHNVLF